jgi:hypothetical protein
MANIFRRFPEPGGDYDVGANYNQYQLESTLGLITSQLYNDSGNLTLKVGQIGIDNGLNKGVVKIDTEVVIDFSGVSNSNWAKIEMAVSGTAPVFTATDIAGATDPSEAPSEFKNAYDGEKGGFYIDSAKRCVGLIWVYPAIGILCIINVCPHINNYWASELGIDVATTSISMKQRGPGEGFTTDIGDWNMDSADGVSTGYNLLEFLKAVSHVKAMIINDDSDDIRPLDSWDPADEAMNGGIDSIMGSSAVSLYRRAGGDFDSVDYDSTSFNRGYCTIYFKDF